MKYPSTNKIINPAATTEEIKDALAKQGMTVFTNEEFATFINNAIRTAVRDGREIGVMDGLRLAMQQNSIDDIKRIYALKEQQNWFGN